MTAWLDRWFKWPSLEGRQLELDAVRTVAILLAVGWHFNHLIGIAPFDWILAPGRRMGWAGVDLFFVLSGFLISGLMFSEFKRSGDFHARRFLVRRVFKIWPVLYLFVLLQLFARNHEWSEYLFQTLFHVQNYFNAIPLKHLWSLAVEEHFYISFSLIYVAMIKWDGSPRRMPLLLGAIMIFALAARFYARSVGIDPQSIQWQTQYRIDGLSCGVMLGWVLHFRPDLFVKLARLKPLMFIIVLANCIFLFQNGKDSYLVQTVGFSFNYIAAAAFVLFCYDLAPLRSGRFARGVAWLGFFSYAMYVYQFVGVRPAEKIVAKLHLAGATGMLASVALDYVGAVVAAVVITIAIERPMLELRDWLFPGIKAAPRVDRTAAQSEETPAAAALVETR